jgi:hypothetical protein
MSKQCSNQLSYPPRAGAYYKRGSAELAIEAGGGETRNELGVIMDK